MSDAAVNPLPAVVEFSPNEEMLARFVVGAVRNGGTMFEGRMYECQVARLLGGDLPPRGVWPWDVRLSDGTRIEVRSGRATFKITGGRDADVWVFVRKGIERNEGPNGASFFVATKEQVLQAQKSFKSVGLRRVDELFIACTASELSVAVTAAAARQ